jgi:hypothetical protein
MPQTKGTTRELAVYLRQKNPCATMASIAAEIGVSRECVRQYLEAEGQRTRRHRPERRCLNCDKVLEGDSYYHTFCSRQCYSGHHNVPIACEECGAIFYRPQNQVLNTHPSHNQRWCSHRCRGKWFGRTHGWGTRRKA